ncbi:isoprenoid synthase domain-containing protein, partial [Mycena floridula]
NHPFENKMYVSMFTWFSIMIDDRVSSMRTPLEQFQKRLLSGEPQLDPFLDHLATFTKETYRYWDPICADAIVTAFLEFVAATVIQDSEKVKGKRGIIETESWPPYIRTKDGEPGAYAYMIFPPNTCPDISVYLQLIPDMCTYLDYNNDILSFYKEEVAGETQNLIHAMAQASGNLPLAELTSVANESLAAVYRVRSVLQGTGIYEETWQAFEHGYVTFHTAGERYKLAEIGLGEDVVEVYSGLSCC